MKKIFKKTILISILIIFYTNHSYSLPVINNISENKDPVGQYEKFELTIDFNANYSNPFDFDTSNGGIDVWAIFTSPQGVTKRVNGFYMDSDGNGSADSWKIRFATGEQGIWSYVVYVKDNTGETNSNTNTFTVTSSTRKGYIRVSNTNPRYLVYESGGSFFGIGHNNGWQNWQNVENPDFSTMANYGENVLSVWVHTPWANPSTDSSRTPMEYDGAGLNNYYQHNGGFIDGLLDRAEQNGIKLILGIWSHDSLRTDSSWNNNAYNDVTSCDNFFTNQTAWSYQEKYYRYIIARWGYSEALLMWDIIIEANLTDGWKNIGSNVVESWLQNVVNYFKNNDSFNHLLTASLSGGGGTYEDPKWPNGYNITGVSQIHSYYQQNNMQEMPDVIASDTIYMWDLKAQPNYIGEFGPSDSNYQPEAIHLGIWAGTCSGASIAPLLWCDGSSYIYLNTPMLEQQQSLRNFVSDIDFENKINQRKTTYVNGYLSYGVGSNDFAICWIYNKYGNIETGKQLEVSTLTDGSYIIKWYDTWSGTYLSTINGTVVSGKLTIDIPSGNYKDIACKILYDTGQPTNTPTNTYTTTYTPTSTPTSDDPTIYHYEDGTVMGWNVYGDQITDSYNTTSNSFYGGHSLGVVCNFTDSTGGNVGTQNPLITDLTGKTLVARVYVPFGFPTGGGGYIYIKSGTGWVWENGEWYNFTSGVWNTIYFDIDNPAYSGAGTPNHSDIKEIGIKIAPPGTFTGTWSGDCFIDSVDVMTGNFTPTETPTSTMTLTSTITPTLTYTPTITYTETLTFTQVEINTYTPTSTITNTFTITSTYTYTETNTHTFTPTITDTFTYTHTYTSTPTGTWFSPTPTCTYTETETYTYTETYTITFTPTPTYTFTLTYTQTETYTYIFTHTPTDTFTIIETNTYTPTSIITNTFTITLTYTYTETNTYTPTNTSTQTEILFSPTPTPTYTETETYTPYIVSQIDLEISNILTFPIPYNKGDLKIKFYINKNAKNLCIKIFTPAKRIIKYLKIKSNIYSKENSIIIREKYLKNLANGIYFYYLEAEDEKGKKINSKIQKLLIIR